MKRKEFYLAHVHYKNGRVKSKESTSIKMLNVWIDTILNDKVKVVNIFHVNKIEEVTYESEEGE